MKILLDACVLFPTVMREVLLGVAERGGFEPLWSERITGEWVRAADRLGPGAREIACGEAALMADRFPGASVRDVPELSGVLPDPSDDHVLAAALAGGAELIMTRNIKDFPLRILGAHGIGRSDPDAFLMTLDAGLVQPVLRLVQARAEAVSGREQPMRALMKRAGLPRIGKRYG